MIDQMTQAYPFTLLALCIWREARGESSTTKLAVAWSIRNRVSKGGWWGNTWLTVILKPWQYSSFNANDPNAKLLPGPSDPSWFDSLNAANDVFDNPASPDPTNGATSYFDKSLDSNPPSWAIDGSKVHTCDIGSLHFYKEVA